MDVCSPTADSSKQGNSSEKTTEQTTSEDVDAIISLPIAQVSRLIKSTAQNYRLSKDAVIAISRCTAFFTLYVCDGAAERASKHSRKKITQTDVLQTLEEIGFKDIANQPSIRK